MAFTFSVLVQSHPDTQSRRSMPEDNCMAFHVKECFMLCLMRCVRLKMTYYSSLYILFQQFNCKIRISEPHCLRGSRLQRYTMFFPHISIMLYNSARWSIKQWHWNAVLWFRFCIFDITETAERIVVKKRCEVIGPLTESCKYTIHERGISC